MKKKQEVKNFMKKFIRIKNIIIYRTSDFLDLTFKIVFTFFVCKFIILIKTSGSG